MPRDDGSSGWPTGITRIEPDEIRLRGYRIDELMGRLRFADVVFLAFRGELPSREEAELLDALLVAAVDHGVTPPSALAARTVASTGAALNASIAAGVLAINRFHGGAIEDAMRLFYEGVRSAGEDGDLASAADALAARLKGEGKRAAGFGHRYHKNDPRTARLFELSREKGLFGPHQRFALAMRESVSRLAGKELPLNVDGAMAAVLCDLGFPPEYANAFFIVARVPGLAAHYFEETTRFRPMRRVTPDAHYYDGPPPRELSDSR